MKKRLLLLFCIMTVFAAALAAANKKFTLVIDAGHGGHDAGAVGKMTKEKTINLNVAREFGRLVEQNCPDVKVIYTRKTDVFVPLHTRADIANRNKADLFISIHTNSLPKKRGVRGMETYTLGMHRAADNLDVAKRENSVILIEDDYKQRYQGFDPRSSESYIMFEFMQDHNMAQSVELAKFVQKRTCSSANRVNKGVKQAGFLVLRETSMPSCLIELGFISTPDEERFLHSSNGVSQLAKGIYQAFLDYKNKYDTNKSPVRKVEKAPEVEAPKTEPKAETPKTEAPKAETPKTEPKKEQPATLPEVASAATEKAIAPATVEAPPATAEVVVKKPASDPVFKVQILACATPLKANDKRLKGHKDVDKYFENGLYKYTIGESANYDEICQLQKSLSDQFPQTFIVAFRNGQRMDIQEAKRAYRKNKNKR